LKNSEKEEKGPMLLSVKEVAKMLGIGERTVWAWAAEGRVPEPLQLGRLKRWRLEEIKQWIAAGCPVRK